MKPDTMQGPLLGRWTYRSFVNNPDMAVDFGTLEFGRGELLVEYACPGTFIGRLIFDETYQFRLQGVATPGDPPTIRIRGIGDAEGSKDQIYDYFGCLMPLWPHKVRKRLTIVGSVVRAVAHNGDSAPAGQVASFIAVKHDVFWEPENGGGPAQQTPAQQPPAEPEKPATEPPEEPASEESDQTEGSDESGSRSSRKRGR
jgi:hypothetical protein